MMQQQLEFIQVVFLLGYLGKAGRQESWPIRIAFLWWIAILIIDITVFECRRPVWMRWGVNSVDMLIGWLVIYEKYREPCQKLVQAVAATLLSLFK